MKIKKVTRLARVGTDVSKPAPVPCDVSAQYAALLAQFEKVEVQRAALLRQVVVLEIQRAAVKSALDVAGTLIALSRGTN